VEVSITSIAADDAPFLECRCGEPTGETKDCFPIPSFSSIGVRLFEVAFGATGIDDGVSS